jgi:putative membrane protein
MTASNDSSGQEPGVQDASRRTRLAAERTWLAWWRTGLAATAGAIAIGRVLPSVTGGAHWPFRLLGLGYGALAIAVLIIGAVRQRHGAEALSRGGYDEMSFSLVAWLTGAAVALAAATLALVAVTV